jgi:hypothetical protein
MNINSVNLNSYNSSYFLQQKDVSFGAKYICPVEVLQKKWFSNEYKPMKAMLVEFDLKSKEDIAVLKKLKDRWSGFASSIYSDVVINKCADSVYAVTKQNDSFEKLQPRKILGLAEVFRITRDKISLEYLQVKPKYAYDEDKFRGLKGIGGALVRFLKSQDDIKKIQVNPTYSAMDFYVKKGFNVSCYDNLLDESLLIWEK